MNTCCDQLRARGRAHEQLPPGQVAVQEVTWVELRALAVLVEQTGAGTPGEASELLGGPLCI